jgi:hypothetical protein
MSFNVQSVFRTAVDLLPGGTLVRSLVEGAGSLLIKKAAKTVGLKEEKIGEVLNEVRRLAADDEEIKRAIKQEEDSRREFELAFYGRAADLSPQAQLWRSITRPLLSLILVALFVLGVLIQYGQQVMGNGGNFLIIPPEVVELAKWVVAFWFTSRGVEKVMGRFK